MKLEKIDYMDILKYYNIAFSEHLPIKLLRKMVDKIIAEKLCRCIKKVPNKDQPESRAIGICNHSVVKKKQLSIYKFTCKKKPKLHLSSDNKDGYKIHKTHNNRLQLNFKKPKTYKKKSKKKTT